MKNLGSFVCNENSLIDVPTHPPRQNSPKSNPKRQAPKTLNTYGIEVGSLQAQYVSSQYEIIPPTQPQVKW